MINFKNFIKDKIYIDLYLFISITLISIMGLVFLYSASQGNIETIIKQSFFVIFGLFLMFIVSQPDPDFYKNNSAIFLIFSLVLVLVTLFFGKEVNGARRWLDLGLFTLQTSEIFSSKSPNFLKLWNNSTRIGNRTFYLYKYHIYSLDIKPDYKF